MVFMANRDKNNHYELVDETQFLTVESFKALRTNLEYSFIGQNNKTILVSSSLPGEGKTTMIANLGVYLTLTGYKVLLVDCDLRKPKLNRFFNVPNTTGLTNIIIKKVPLEAAIRTINAKLSILCSGPIPPNPIEILNSKEMEILISALSNSYDYILIDTPPAQQLSDAVVLSRITNGVILTIKHLSTPIEAIKETIDNFKKVNANIIGTVISQINIKKHANSKYKYCEYYNKEEKKQASTKKKYIAGKRNKYAYNELLIK